MASRALLATTSHSSLWGDVQVKLVGDDNSTVITDCEVNPVPSVRDLFYHHELSMLIAWCIGGFCALFALIICYVHLSRFGRYEATNRRKYFTGVVLMAPVFAITNYLSMFFPRAAAVFELIQHVYEAQALFSFGMLIFDLASDGETDYLVAREIFLAKLALCEPRKLDASPPLCFLGPCVKHVRVDDERLDGIMGGLKVFGYVVPACAITRLWITVEAKNEIVISGSQIGLLLIENVAMSYTLWNLFQLYVCTHDVLHHYRTTDKFIAIKAVLGIAVLQDMIIKVVVKKFIGPSYFTVEMKSEFWADFALTVEAIILAYAHMKAYPQEELNDARGDYAAKRAMAKAHALEMLALPRGPHANGGAHAGGHEELAAVEVQQLAPQEEWPEEGEGEEAWPARTAGVPALQAPPAQAATAAAPRALAAAPAPAPKAGFRQPTALPPPAPPSAAEEDGSDWTDATPTDSEAPSAPSSRPASSLRSQPRR